MNLVNLTTAIHRLAKMVANDSKAQAHLKESPILPKLLPLIASMLSSAPFQDIQPQSLCNILWSLASIRIIDTQVISLVCQHTPPKIDSFKPFELSLLLWALAKLSTIECSSPFDTTQLKGVFDVASKHIVQNVRSIECRCLSMVVWAYATARQSDGTLFSVVAAQMAKAPTHTCQEMANTIWAYGTQNITHTDLFKSLAQKGARSITGFKAQELSNMVWGFASAGFFHEQFYQLAATAALSKDLSTQHMANILWAFTRVRPRHPLTQRTVLSFLPLCCQQLRRFKAQEVSSVTLSVAKTFSDSESACPSVFAFFNSVSKIRYHLTDFSTQSLTNMSSGLVMMHLLDCDLLVNLGEESVRRAPLMAVSDLFRIFQVFHSAKDSSRHCDYIAGLLVSPLADRLKNLRPREIKALSHSCSDLLRDLTRQDLLEKCAQIIDSASSSDTCSQCSSTKFARDFEASATETDEPVNSISELSDSTEEDVESSKIASDTERSAQEQTPCVRVSAPTSSQQHVYSSNFSWFKQQPFWCSGQGFAVIPMPVAPTPQNAYSQNLGATSMAHTTLIAHREACKNPNLVPPPSSLLWDVDDDSNSARLRDGKDRLQQHSEDVAFQVTVKNTFIECQYACPQGISAVQFASEKVSRCNDSDRTSDASLTEVLVQDDVYDTDDGF
jgi:hypothetical protein